MNAELVRISNLEMKLNIQIPVEKVQKAFETALKEVRDSASIKGFRKGKAPLNVVRAKYFDDVRQHVLQNLISESYLDALKKHSLHPITDPQIDIKQFEENQDLTFSAQFEVRPEIQVEKTQGLEVERKTTEFSDSQVEDVLENLRRSQSELVPVFEDRSAREADVVTIDFKGWLGLEPLEGGSATDHQVELGSESMIPGFEEGIIGMNLNQQKSIDVIFPEDYHAKEIAGKQVRFDVTLKKLEKRSLPDLNDELAKKSGKFETLEELKEAISSDLKQRESQNIESDVKKQLLEALVKANPVEIPPSLLQKQAEQLAQDFAQRLSSQGMPPEQIQEQLVENKDEIEKSARFMIQSSLLVDKIASDQDIRVQEADLNRRLDEYAKQNNIELDRLREFYNQRENRDRLEFQILEEKVVDYLRSHAQIT